jgi:hypothetical protein
MSKKEAYLILGVSPNATASEIREKQTKLMMFKGILQFNFQEVPLIYPANKPCRDLVIMNAGEI